MTFLEKLEKLHTLNFEMDAPNLIIWREGNNESKLIPLLTHTYIYFIVSRKDQF